MAVITISRQYGSGGDEVACQLCALLGYRYFDKALMRQVASEVGLSFSEIVDFSEDNYKIQSFLDRLLHVGQLVAQVNVWRRDPLGVLTEDVEALDAAQSLTLVQSTIQTAYQHGNVVIVGRGGQVILKDKPDVLHVRIEAPLTERFERIHEQTTFSLAGAKDLAITRDRAAADYLKRFYGMNWADPELYDLVINTGKFGVEGAVQLIANALDCIKAAQPSPHELQGMAL
jgi:cytidylate kinase